MPRPVPPPPPRIHFVGLDLGQTADFSALSVVEKMGERLELVFAHRGELGTRYPQIVNQTLRMVQEPPLNWPTLALDQTGVGAAIVDLFRQSDLRATLKAVHITAGSKVTYDDGVWNVPKRELVGSLQAAFQTGMLRIAPDLPYSEVLEEEMLAFRVKVTASGNEIFESWRERAHDDLVLSVALAVWAAGRIGDRDVGEPLILGRRPNPCGDWLW